MAGIITRNLSVSGEGNNKHLILRNGSVSRGLAIGSNWSHLGIAIRCRVNATASVSGGTQLVVGVGYGLSGWASPINAFGLRLNPFTLSYNGTNKIVGAVSTLGRWTSKRGASTTDYDQGGGLSACAITTDETKTTIIIASIYKGTNWVCEWESNVNGASPTSTFDLEDLLYAMEQGNRAGAHVHLYTTLGQNVTYGTLGSVSVPSSTIAEATYGYLDSVFVHWNHNDPPLEIADIVVAKWA